MEFSLQLSNFWWLMSCISINRIGKRSSRERIELWGGKEEEDLIGTLSDWKVVSSILGHDSCFLTIVFLNCSMSCISIDRMGKWSSWERIELREGEKSGKKKEKKQSSCWAQSYGLKSRILNATFPHETSGVTRNIRQFRLYFSKFGFP